MFCVSRNLAAFYNLRAHSANPDISRISCSASRFSKKNSARGSSGRSVHVWLWRSWLLMTIGSVASCWVIQCRVRLHPLCGEDKLITRFTVRRVRLSILEQ